jgi:hypothetical protein
LRDRGWRIARDDRVDDHAALVKVVYLVYADAYAVPVGVRVERPEAIRLVGDT